MTTPAAAMTTPGAPAGAANDFKEQEQPPPHYRNNQPTPNPFSLVARTSPSKQPPPQEDHLSLAESSFSLSSLQDHLLNSRHDRQLHDDGAARALLVQNERLVSRVKELETTLANTTATHGREQRLSLHKLKQATQAYINVTKKHERALHEHDTNMVECQQMVVDRIEKATLLHLGTKEALLAHVKQLQQQLGEEKKQRHIERGGLEGRVLMMERDLEAQSRAQVRARRYMVVLFALELGISIPVYTKAGLDRVGVVFMIGTFLCCFGSLFVGVSVP